MKLQVRDPHSSDKQNASPTPQEKGLNTQDVTGQGSCINDPLYGHVLIDRRKCRSQPALNLFKESGSFSDRGNRSSSSGHDRGNRSSSSGHKRHTHGSYVTDV